MQENIIVSLFNKYNLGSKDKKYLTKIINPIINHPEFQRRMTKEFLHHANITLGEHILEDTILAYLIAKKKNDVKIELVIKIALFHDLYTIPWQNNKEARVKHFFNKHGFRHPVEAVINAITWYPEYFINDADIIIDGIIHHMFPLAVRSFDKKGILKIELKNIDSFNKLDEIYQNMIIASVKRVKIGPISLARSKYKEGRILSLADKKVSIKQIKNLASLVSLLTGHNKSLKK